MNFPSIYDHQNEALTIIEEKGSNSQSRGIPTNTNTITRPPTLQPSYLSYNHQLRQAVATQGRHPPHSQFQDQDEQRVVEILTGDLDLNEKEAMRSDYGQYPCGNVSGRGSGYQQSRMGMGMGKMHEEQEQGMLVDWYGSPDGGLGMGCNTTMNGSQSQSQGQGQGYTYEDEGHQSARGSVDASTYGGVGLGNGNGHGHGHTSGSSSTRDRIGSGSSGLSFIPSFEEEVGYGEEEFEYDGQSELKGLGLGFGSGVADGHGNGNEQQEDLADFDEYNIVAGPPADYYRDQIPAYAQQQQPLSATHGSAYAQQQQHGYDEYYGNYNRKVSSYAQRGASPFGAIGSETNRFDPFGQSLARQQQQQQLANGYSHPQAQVKSYEEQYYAVDQSQAQGQMGEQVVVAPVPAVAPSPEEALAASGVGLSGFLAEAVWELCMLPFEPAKRVLGDGFEGYGGQYGYGRGYDQYGNGDAYSMHGRHYSGYSSPDLVSLRELQEPHSGYASPVTMSSPINASMNPYQLRSKPSAAFVDFVHRTLSQTLLSPTAVILALWYIRRLAIHTGGEQDGLMLRQMLHLSAQGNHGAEEAARRILTLGLMFSNKNLDDNTFTNKSWSDVTHLPLLEINRLELHALGPLKFDLSITHVEWETWVHTVEQRVTPFITDGLAVQNTIHSMHLALRIGRARFEEEIVVKREQAEMEAQEREREMSGYYEVEAGRKAYYTATNGDYNWSPTHSGNLSPSYMSQAQEQVLPSIASLTDGVDITGLKSGSGYPRPEAQAYEAYSSHYRQHQLRARNQIPASSVYPATANSTAQYVQGYSGYPHSSSHATYEQENRRSDYGNVYQNLNLGNQYYLSQLAAGHDHGYGHQQHQPRMMSIMA